MTDINIGPAAINRTSYAAAGYTYIDLANPADGTGNITTITCYIPSAVTNGLRVGIFYATGVDTYKCRSTVSLGTAALGPNTYTTDFSGNPISIGVESGDFIGSYWTSGQMNYVGTGGSVAYQIGEFIDVGDETTYAANTFIISVHGLGDVVEPPCYESIPNGFFCIYQEPVAKNLFLYPDGDYSISMVSVGATPHYACVDETRDVPDNDDTYVYTTSVSNVSDIYTLQDSTVGGTINYVQAYGNAKSHIYSQSASGIYKIFLDLGGVQDLSADFDLTTDYGLYTEIFSLDPNGAAWTWANVNVLRLGILASSPSVSTTANAIFRPNGVGGKTEFSPVGAATNWDCVNEDTPNYDIDYVWQYSGGAYKYDTYALPNHTTENGTINYVSIFNYARKTSLYAYMWEYMKLYTNYYTGTTQHILSGNYDLYSTTWVSSPSDSSTWKWVNIDNIESGICLYGQTPAAIPMVTQNYLVINYNTTISPQIHTTQAYIKVNYTSEVSCYFLRQPETYTLSHDRNIKIFNTWSEHIVRDDGRNSKNLTLNGCEYESQATYRLRLVRNAVEEGLDCRFYGLFDGNLNTDWHIKSFNYDRDAQNPNIWNYTMNCESA